MLIITSNLSRYIYPDKKANDAINFVKSRVLPVYSDFDITLDITLTNNGREYTIHLENVKHDYGKFLVSCDIKHTKI
ncbi:MAG: hypothetical protein WAW45_02985 [Atribacterota bacterium]